MTRSLPEPQRTQPGAGFFRVVILRQATPPYRLMKGKPVAVALLVGTGG